MRAFSIVLMLAAYVLAMCVLFAPDPQPAAPLILLPCPAAAPSLAPPTFAPDPKFLNDPEDLKKV